HNGRVTNEAVSPPTGRPGAGAAAALAGGVHIVYSEGSGPAARVRCSWPMSAGYITGRLGPARRRGLLCGMGLEGAQHLPNRLKADLERIAGVGDGNPASGIRSCDFVRDHDRTGRVGM